MNKDPYCKLLTKPNKDVPVIFLRPRLFSFMTFLVNAFLKLSLVPCFYWGFWNLLGSLLSPVTPCLPLLIVLAYFIQIIHAAASNLSGQRYVCFTVGHLYPNEKRRHMGFSHPHNNCISKSIVWPPEVHIYLSHVEAATRNLQCERSTAMWVSSSLKMKCKI